MTLHIDDDCMSLEVNGTVTRVAVRLGYLWRVTGWPRLLSGNEAITALTSRLAPFLAQWRSAVRGCSARGLHGA